MGWLKSAAGWGLAIAVGGAILGAVQQADDLWVLTLTMAIVGTLFGLFFHHRGRVDTQEDNALGVAVLDPDSTDHASEWLRQLHAGHRVNLRRSVTLTPDGVEWTGLWKASIRWRDVESARTWAAGSHGIRSVRVVYLRANDKERGIACTKHNFDDVLATCTAMMRATT